MSGKPDPVQIIAATLRRFLPQEAGAADILGQTIVRELQRNGWCDEWTPIQIHGASLSIGQRQ